MSAPEILSGEFAGQQIAAAFVAFHGFRLDWAKRTEKESEISFEEAMEYLGAEPLFVFSCWTDGSCCEICGLGEQEAIAMLFSFDAVTVEWDVFAEKPVGTLTKG